jgi:hypothetical protein
VLVQNGLQEIAAIIGFDLKCTVQNKQRNAPKQIMGKKRKLCDVIPEGLASEAENVDAEKEEKTYLFKVPSPINLKARPADQETKAQMLNLNIGGLKRRRMDAEKQYHLDAS